LEDAMKRLVELVVTAAMLTIPAAASAQTLTKAQARAAIAPWYQLLNQPVQGDMRGSVSDASDAAAWRESQAAASPRG
jgi:glutamate synthase domain-containing protein 1